MPATSSRSRPTEAILDSSAPIPIRASLLAATPVPEIAPRRPRLPFPARLPDLRSRAAAVPLQRTLRAAAADLRRGGAALDGSVARACRALLVSAVMTPLLEAPLADQILPGQAGGARRHAPRGRRCRPDHRSGRKRRPGGRIRLRQIHHGAPARSPHRSDSGTIAARRTRTSPPCRRRSLPPQPRPARGSRSCSRTPTESLNPSFRVIPVRSPIR